MKSVSGYLECDDSIVRITSLGDIKDFLIMYGKSAGDMTEKELSLLTKQKINDYNLIKDDCGVLYCQNPIILQCGVPIISYKVKEGTVAIADEAFALQDFSDSKQFSLNSILLPESLVAIGHSSFKGKRNLSTINFTSSLKFIGNKAFYNCNKLKQVVLPESTKYLGTHAFEGTGITTITIPSQVEKIGSFAFANCTLLKDVVFKGIPKRIGSNVFGSDSSLEKITIPMGTLDYFIKELFPL